MEYLRGEHISFRYETQSESLLTDVSFSLDRAARVGLIGNNGSGKTTLIALIRGELIPSQGHITIRPDSRIGFLPQEVAFEETIAVTDYLWSARPEIDPLRQKMKAADQASVEYAELVASFYDAGGGVTEAAIEKLLDGFRLHRSVGARSLHLLSGGEKTKVALARLLLVEPDILILDEPTNHLEIAALEWLESYLQTLTAPYIVISHDRRFLDTCTNEIWELADNTLTVFSGNYSFYREAKDTDRRRRQAQYDRAQQKARQLREAAAAKRAESERVEKFKPKRSVSKKGSIQKRDAGSGRSQANSSNAMRTATSLERRLKALLQKAQEEKPFIEKERRITIETDPVANPMPLLVENLKHRFGDQTVLDDLSFSLRNRSRLGLIGPNGSGKSTLLKILAGVLAPTGGTYRWAPEIRIGYFSQEHETLDPRATILDEVLQGRLAEQTQARIILGGLGLRRDKVLQLIATLSLGERSKTALARVLFSRANVLLLDEPTNHLELSAREALEEALADYEGTLLLASHDRYLLERITTGILDLETGRFYDGGYSEFIGRGRE